MSCATCKSFSVALPAFASSITRSAALVAIAPFRRSLTPANHPAIDDAFFATFDASLDTQSPISCEIAPTRRAYWIASRGDFATDPMAFQARANPT